MQDGNPPNFDALIFPIIEKTSSSINDALTLNGLTLKNASPNPAQDHITLDINIEHSSFITVDVVSNDGKVLQTITKENCLSGNHQITLDLSGLNSGSYYYLVKTNFTQFGSKFTIVK
jgi:hypothetical protein